ncbi:caspase family protein [Kitasatospora sp. NPDC001540]|uniref:caspase family protein n=1 Tax=Kitasatospora sp. NPDC001540 TaxID=3364014 RepID=UPI003686236D
MTGIALHIGLNGVDPDAYEGWDGALDAGEPDALALERITRKLRYDTRTLLTRQATTKAVLGEISRAATTLRDGDIFVLTYAGHGGQLADLDGDEPDHRDETWVLYDRQLLDDELRVALSGFPAGVRVVVVSDSCHSGTVIRDSADALMSQRGIAAAFAEVAPRARGRDRSRAGASRAVAETETPKVRQIPSDVQRRVQAEQGARYRAIRRGVPRAEESAVDASVLLLAACMDNQTAAEQFGHGLFTATLLEQWDGRRFAASYQEVISTARTQLPPLQSPNLLTLGRTRPGFKDQTLFALAPPTDAAPDPGQQADTLPAPPGKAAPVTGSDQPVPPPAAKTAPHLSVTVGVTLRPADRVSELLLDLLAAAVEDPEDPGPRDPATLHLDTLSCEVPDDLGGDEPYLTFNGERVWSASGVNDGDARVVGFRREFAGSVTVGLHDEELGTDDEIGSCVIGSEEAGRGTRTAFFSGPGGARYSLTYTVE